MSFLSVATYCEQSNTKSVDISGRYSHLNQTNKEKRTGKNNLMSSEQTDIFFYILNAPPDKSAKTIHVWKEES